MTNEEMLNRIGNALIAAGTSLITGQVATVNNSHIDESEWAAGEEKKTTKKKASKKKASKKKATTTKAAEESIDKPIEENTQEVTHDMLRTKLVEVAKDKGKEEAFGILAKFGAKKVNEVPNEKYGELWKALQ